MKEFRKRRSKQDEIMSLGIKALAVLVLLCVTVFLLRAAWGMYGKMSAASHAQDEAEAQLKSSQTQHQGVAVILAESTSERGVEQQLRDRYGVVKPGEGEIDVIRFAPASSTTQTPKDSWWRRMFRALFVW